MAKTTKKGTIVPFEDGVAALDRRERERSPAYAALAGAVDVMFEKGDLEGLQILSRIISSVDAKHGPLL